MKNCSILAATLSAAYRSNEPYHPPVNDYLKSNGILLTMCMSYKGLLPPFLCSSRSVLAKKEDHIAASWVQADVTGFRVVEPPVDIGPPVGYVLDPSYANISCLYPFDAATDQRLDRGCGELEDPNNSWNPILRWLTRRYFIRYKNEVFGKDTPWSSIPCSELFFANISLATLCTGPAANATCKDLTQGRTELNFVSQPIYDAVVYEELLGHVVCNKTGTPGPSFDEDKFLLYLGDCSWKPNEWPHMVKTMNGFLQDHPKIGVWNEIVLDIPQSFDDLIQAVFYVSDGAESTRAHGIAIREAKKRNKPLLKVKASSSDDPNENLFHCADEKDEHHPRQAHPSSSSLPQSPAPQTTSRRDRQLRG